MIRWSASFGNGHDGIEVAGRAGLGPSRIFQSGELPPPVAAARGPDLDCRGTEQKLRYGYHGYRQSRRQARRLPCLRNGFDLVVNDLEPRPTPTADHGGE